MNTLIKHGKRFIDGGWETNEGLCIHEQKIVSLDETPGLSPEQEIDATNCLIMPGLIDLCAHLREPGQKEKGTIASETAAAAAGGVTTLCCSPDTRPANDSKAVTNLITELAEASGHCRVLPLGALTKGLDGEHLSEYAALKEAGCVALNNAYFPLQTPAVAKRCFEYAKTHRLSVFVNPIEPSLHQGAMHGGKLSTRIGLEGIPSLAETIAVAMLIKLAEQTQVHLHLSQLSTADAVEQVATAKARGLFLTADVAMPNLLFTEEKVGNFNNIFRLNPPLREESDRQALLKGLRDGVIDAITSAHSPHEAASRQMPFTETTPGMSSIEMLLPMAWELDQKGELPIEIFVNAMTEGPAKVLQRTPARLAAGQIADVTIFNPQTEWSVTEDTIYSKGKNTPFLNTMLTGKVQTTFLHGKVAYTNK